MSFKNKIGVKVNIPGDLETEKKLFGESGGFILEVARDKLNDVKKIFADKKIAAIQIGETTDSSRLQLNDVIDLQVSIAKESWENGLREKLL